MKFTTLKLGVLALGLFTFTQGNAQEKKKPDPEKMFASFDTNSDKSISLDEFKNKKRKNELSLDVLEKRYANMDANADGAVTLDEFKADMMKPKKPAGNTKAEGKKNKKAKPVTEEN